MNWIASLRRSVRTTLRNPAHAVTVIFLLALGIGTNVAIYSVVDGVLLQPLPHADGHRIVYVRQAAERVGVENVLMSVAEINDFREGVDSFESVTEFSALTFTMVGYGEPRQVRAGIVTGDFFDTMGLGALAGRTIQRSDDGQSAEQVAVFTHAFWRATGADPDIVGKVVEINGRSIRIVGVAVPAPAYPERTDIYVNMVSSPHHMGAAMQSDRMHRMTEVLARLAPGATLEQAEAEVKGVAARMYSSYPEAYDPLQGFAVSLSPLTEAMVRDARPTLLLVLGASAFVFLTACANVASLVVARVVARGDELAVRASLGATPRHLRAYLFSEHLVPAALGGLAGIGVAAALLGVLVRLAERLTPRAVEVSMDARALAVAVVLTLVAATLFALVPRLPASILEEGRGSTRVAGDRRSRRLQGGLIVLQVAVSVSLLAGAGLLLRSLLSLQGVDPGVDTQNVLSLEIPTAGLSRDPYYFPQILRDIEAVPGVEAAALTTRIPLRGRQTALNLNFGVEGEGRAPEGDVEIVRADYRVVSPSYFATMGIDVLEGRPFDGSDRADAAPVAVLSESLAMATFGTLDVVGKGIRWSDPALRFVGVDNEWRRIVGVARDVTEYGPLEGGERTLYMPFDQEQRGGGLVIRSRRTPEEIIPDVRLVIRSANPDQPIENVATLVQIRDETIAPQRVTFLLVGVFAVSAVIIAAVGLAAALAFAVRRREREIGVRAALGADRSSLVRMVTWEGVRLAVAGVGIGALGAALLGQAMQGLLFQVAPTDPAVLTGVVVLTLLAATGAAMVPAWQAAKADPATTLRS